MKNQLLALLCLLPLCGNAVPVDLEGEADNLRNSAMEKFEHGDRDAAFKLNRAALRITRHLPESSWRTVENYDDAGLYHYDAHHWKAAAQNQAISVLLSCGVPETEAMFPEYLKRLGWAFAKYRPNEDFGPIAENPLLLLTDIRFNLRANADLRRRFFDTIKVLGTPSGSTARYIYKLKPETVPESCFPIRHSWSDKEVEQ